MDRIIKRCTRCEVEHVGTIEELHRYFNWQNKPNNRLQNICRECHRKSNRKYRENNKEKYDRASREFREKNKTYMKEKYEERKRLSEIFLVDVNILTVEELEGMKETLLKRLVEVERKLIEKG